MRYYKRSKDKHKQFSHGLLHMDTPALGDEERTYIHQLCGDTGCSLKDQPTPRDDRGRESENFMQSAGLDDKDDDKVVIYEAI